MDHDKQAGESASSAGTPPQASAPRTMPQSAARAGGGGSKTPAYVFLSLLIVALALLAVLLYFQIGEKKYYNDPPSIWPASGPSSAGVQPLAPTAAP